MKALLALLMLTLLPASAMAKGEGVGLWMEGRVSEVRPDGQTIRLVLNGRFWFEQYRRQEPSRVEVRDLRGGDATIPVAITQGKPFFAMADGWGAGAIRADGELLNILRAAATTGRVVRFELVSAKVTFGNEGRFAVESGEVIRATDHQLR